MPEQVVRMLQGLAPRRMRDPGAWKQCDAQPFLGSRPQTEIGILAVEAIAGIEAAEPDEGPVPHRHEQAGKPVDGHFVDIGRFGRAPVGPSFDAVAANDCLLYTSPSPRDLSTSRMPSSA